MPLPMLTDKKNEESQQRTLYKRNAGVSAKIKQIEY